jgi:hypothetical protein
MQGRRTATLDRKATMVHSTGEQLAMCGHVFPSYRAAVDAGHAVGNYTARADTLSSYHARGIECESCIVRHSRSGGAAGIPA